jgi:5-methylcytosine-specific restriction endonuclease McrA
MIMPNLPNRAKRYDKADTRKFHGSNEWVKARDMHKAKYPTCQRCAFMGSETRESVSRLEVHHITPLAIDYSKRTDADNLLTVCRPCHNIYTRMENTSRTAQSIAEGEEVRYYTQDNSPMTF